MAYDFDPELASALSAIPVIDLANLNEARATLSSLVAAMSTDLDMSDLIVRDTVASSNGISVPARLYAPATEGNGAGLLYIHGGGFVMGDLDSGDLECARLVRELGVTILSVGYRLAPEHPYPAALEDCYAALCWFHGQAGALDIEMERIGIFGKSAGGGLAAALALIARDRGGPSICFQYLGIPELDDRLDTPSMIAFTDTPIWNRSNAAISWAAFLGKEYAVGGADVPAYAAPARETNFGGLPPAYISVMAYDPLRDEGVRYALRLIEAGVAVELHAFPGTFHSSELIETAKVSQRQHAETIEVLRCGLVQPAKIESL